MAAARVPMRTLQEWMGHRDYKTTLIYAPIAHEREPVERAFGAQREPAVEPVGAREPHGSGHRPSRPSASRWFGQAGADSSARSGTPRKILSSETSGTPRRMAVAAIQRSALCSRWASAWPAASQSARS